MTWWQDLRYAARVLVKSPGFTVAAALSLALGIGGNTAIFTLVNAVLLRSLPVADPQEIFVVKKSVRGQENLRFSWPLFTRLRDALPPSAGLAALTPTLRFNAVIGDQAPEIVEGQLVSGEYFSVLGVRAALGRTLRPADNQTLGAHPVAVISHRFWERRWGRDPGAVGAALKLNGASLTIVGVTPPGFFGAAVGTSPDVWLPVMVQADVRYYGNASSSDADVRKPWAPQEGVSWLNLVARARPAASAAGLAARLDGVFRQDLARRAEAISNADERAVFLRQRLELEPGSRGLAGLRRQLGEPLAVLMASVAMVLIIACANVANLMLVHAAARQKEMAVRLAVGAGTSRLVRQLLTQSVLLGLVGGGLGLLVAQWGAPALLRLQIGARATGGLDLAPDVRVLSFTAGLSLLTGVLFGLVPAFRSTRVDLVSALKASGRTLHGSGSGSGRRASLAKALVVAQVAVSLLLLVAAGLFVHTLRNLARLDPGFDRDQVLSVRIDPRGAGYDEAQLPALYDRLTQRLAALPGARSASVSLFGLVSGCARTSGVSVEGYTPTPGEETIVQENFVSADYFATVGLTLVRGRGFDARDGEKAPKVAVINESMARAFFGGRDPIGRRFGYEDANRQYEIVGVVRDARVNNLREAIPRMAFMPVVQNVDDRYVRNIEVRASGDGQALMADVRRALREAEPALPVLDVTTVADQVDRTLAQERLVAQVTGLFSLLALSLACLGLYGVMAHAVARRTSELGIRLALGAARGQVLGSVLLDALKLVAGGITVGLPLALAGGRIVASLLFGLGPSDPRTLAAVTLLLLGVASFAAYLPARRAARVDPMVALRCE